VPYLAEIETARVLLDYVNSLDPAHSDAAAAAKGKADDASSGDGSLLLHCDLPDGARAVGKAVRQEEDFFGGARSKKRGKKGRRRGGDAGSGGAKKAPKSIVVSPATLEQFAKLKVDPPLLPSQLGTARQALTEKLAELEAKSKQERERVLADIAKEEAAEAAAAKKAAAAAAEAKSAAVAAAQAGDDGEAAKAGADAVEAEAEAAAAE